MPRIPIKIIALSFCCIQGLLAETMQEYLQETVAITRKGDYETALERHIWFHENALKKEPSMMGVRLSFALMYWQKLGEKYPPALSKLQEIRDQGERKVKEGTASFEQFHDVSAINRTLGEPERTLQLYRKLVSQDSPLVENAWIVIKDTAFDLEAYDLINTRIPDIEKEYRLVYAKYLRELNSPGLTDHQDWIRERFKKETEQLAQLATYNNNEELAEKIRSRAKEVLASEDGLVG